MIPLLREQFTGCTLIQFPHLHKALHIGKFFARLISLERPYIEAEVFSRLFLCDAAFNAHLLKTILGVTAAYFSGGIFFCFSCLRFLPVLFSRFFLFFIVLGKFPFVPGIYVGFAEIEMFLLGLHWK